MAYIGTGLLSLVSVFLCNVLVTCVVRELIRKVIEISLVGLKFTLFYSCVKYIRVWEGGG